MSEALDYEELLKFVSFLAAMGYDITVKTGKSYKTKETR